MSLAINEKKICGYLDEKHIAHKDLGYSYLVSAIKLLCKERSEEHTSELQSQR